MKSWNSVRPARRNRQIAFMGTCALVGVLAAARLNGVPATELTFWLLLWCAWWGGAWLGNAFKES